MANVSATLKKELYKIEITSPTGNVLIADEPVDKGGKNSGFSPKELLAASLAACTSATVRMFADRKQWLLDEVKVDIELERDEAANKTVIQRKVQFIGNLDDDQRKKLLAVANACPLHKILTNPIEINTTM